MFKTIKFLEWNIHGAAGYGNYSIPKFVADVISIKDVDIAILVEFINGCGLEYLKGTLEKKYCLFISPYMSGQNQILIAVKKRDGFNIDSIKICADMKTTKKDLPDFLQIEIPYNNHLVYFIGIRIRPGHDIISSQFESLNEHLASLPEESKCICSGDFNAFHQYCVDNLLFLDSEILPNWSNHKEEFSYIHKNGKMVQLDHIMFKNVLIKDKEVHYLWNFINKENGYGNLRPEEYKSFLIGLPDHAFLNTKIVL